MQIKDGFNSKPTNISISSNDNGSIELWIEQTGLPEGQKQDTLSYLTADELHKLYLEVKRAGRDLFE